MALPVIVVELTNHFVAVGEPTLVQRIIFSHPADDIVVRLTRSKNELMIIAVQNGLCNPWTDEAKEIDNHVSGAQLIADVAGLGECKSGPGGFVLFEISDDRSVGSDVAIYMPVIGETLKMKRNPDRFVISERTDQPGE